MRIRRCLAAAVTSSLLLAACGASHGNAGQAKASQSKTSSAQANPAPPSPCLPGSCGASVNGTSTTAPASASRAPSAKALQAWGAAHVATIQSLSDEASHLLGGAGSADQVKLACSALGSHAQAALSLPPPPDAATASQLQTGLTDLSQLARDCAAAFATGDATASSRLIYEANQGTTALSQVIQTVNGAGRGTS